MIKVTYDEPTERKVVIETTEYGAQFIAYCLNYFAAAAGHGAFAAGRAANAISTSEFKYDYEKVNKLFR